MVLDITTMNFKQKKFRCSWSWNFRKNSKSPGVHVASHLALKQHKQTLDVFTFKLAGLPCMKAQKRWNHFHFYQCNFKGKQLDLLSCKNICSSHVLTTFVYFGLDWPMFVICNRRNINFMRTIRWRQYCTKVNCCHFKTSSILVILKSVLVRGLSWKRSKRNCKTQHSKCSWPGYVYDGRVTLCKSNSLNCFVFLFFFTLHL